jgi:HEAT repeat protein
MAAKTLPDWLQDLQSGDAQRIKEAVRALSYIGQEAVPPVINLITRSNVGIEHLAEVIKQIGGTGIDAVTNLLVHANPHVQQRAVAVLAYARDNRSVLPLVMALKSRDETTRGVVAQALGNFSDGAAIPALLEVIQNDTNAVRAKAAQSLGGFTRDPRALHTLISLSTDENAQVRGGAVQGLARINGDERVQEALEKATEDSDSLVRQLAAAALQHQRGDLMAFQRLNNTDDLVEDEVQQILRDGRLSDTDMDAMRHSNPMVRARLIEVVGMSRKTNAFNMIFPALNDINPAVRRSGVEVLARMGSAVIEPLIKAIQNTKSVVVKTSAAQTLGLIADSRALPALLMLLKDEAPAVRLSAAKALMTYPPETALIEGLQEAVNDNDEEVREQVVALLKQHGIEPETGSTLRRFFKRFTRGK